MKTTILMLMLATAGFAEVVAKVPFAFEAAGVKLPGGAYALRQVSGTNGVSWVLRNEATFQSVMMIRKTQGDARKGEEGAFRFRCTDAGRCALTEFWKAGEARNILNTPQWVKEQGSDRLVALGR